MIDLKSIEFAGFGAFLASASVKLNKRGLVLILGENLDTDAASSNGAGKTTVFKAISWALYGKTVDGLTTNVRHVDATAAHVEIVFKSGGRSYKVVREQKKRAGTLAFLEKKKGEWEVRTQSTKAHTQAAIVEQLGLDWHAFRCCCLFGQGDTSRFASPGVNDAARKEILSKVLGLGIYEQARERAREEGKAQGERSKTAGDLEYELSREQSSSREALARLEAESEGLLELQAGGEKRVREAQRELKGAKDELAFFDTGFEEAQGIVDKAVRRLNKARASEDAEAEVKASFSRAAHERRQKLDALKGEGPCPTCGAERSKPAGKSELARAKDKHENAVDAHNEANQKLRGLKEKARDAAVTVSDAESELRQLYNKEHRLRKEVPALERGVKELRHDLGQIDGRLAKASKKTKKLKKALKKTAAQMAEAEAERETAAVRKDMAGWWVKALGPKGVPAFAIEAVLPVLNSKTNRHLLELADGDLIVEWSPTAPTTSGGEKEELTLGLVVEGVEGAQPSGGQMRKIELATELALAEIVRDREGTGTNALFLDEAFDGLDDEGRERVCEWLPTLDFGSIFVVSHTDEIKGAFNRVLLVTKKGKGATLSEG